MHRDSARSGFSVEISRYVGHRGSAPRRASRASDFGRSLSLSRAGPNGLSVAWRLPRTLIPHGTR